MSRHRIIPNPDLTVGDDNKQRWNQPEFRRHGFHNAHRLFRRCLMVRSREVLELESAEQNLCARVPELAEMLAHPAFSAFCCLKDDQIILEKAANDFSALAPHSIQSVTKLHIHIIIGRLLGQGHLSLDAQVCDYLPDMGSGYAKATVQSLLDMSVDNDFTEDYADPKADCYAEEVALGWRLPDADEAETTLAEFAASITGFRANSGVRQADYKSANTDVLTLIAAKVSPIPLAEQIEEIVDASGYEGAFHISLSKDGYPAFSGGGCLCVRDLARFGLLLAREGRDLYGRTMANTSFLQETLIRHAPAMTPPKNWLKYSNQIMTDGRLIGHAGYGGQFLMVDMVSGTSCAFLSVLENDSGYDDAYMGELATTLRDVCFSVI
ncbi:6-aminohexanoate-dimer hydrolase [Ruegeria denitrificans]|uniref:6-aminohexanoate-dimer hydrolase n=1 Tax=Ruegeria denitrificans TaxID=1715692 RepID=A0A0N7M829_9RHOB|nr:serine hydrolase [Ruegeria denitrificans]CUJ82856.1 6-aminohexanoate-dimer hydrolase [Ruegeria denitrificans]